MSEKRPILGESLELCQAAAKWFMEQETVEEKNARISKELMEKYAPMIIQRHSETSVTLNN